MPAPHFIRKRDVRELVLLRAGADPVISQFPALRQFIIGRCGRDVAALFAEPVIGGGEQTDISWYCEPTGEPVPLHALDAEARRAPEDRLRAQLSALAPLLGDAEFGPLLAAALYVANEDAVLVVGREVVLVDWGALPKGLHVASPAAQQHFARTLGRYAPFPPPAVFPQSSAAAALPAEPAPMVHGFAEQPTVHGFAEQKHLLVAIGIAAMLLLLLVLPGFLKTPPSLAAVPGNAELEALVQRQRETNKALKGKIEVVRGAIGGAVCRADGTFGGSNGSPVAPSPERAQVQPEGDGGVKTTLKALFEKSVVMVLAVADENHVGTGTGFFIGPKTIVTNRHVIEAGKNYFITNRSIGSAKPAKVIAQTPNSEKGHPDFAVLQIEADVDAPPIALSSAVDLLLDVWAVGFPGFLTDLDPSKRALLSGDVNAAPSVIASQGIVQVVQGSGSQLPIVIHSANMAPGNSGGPLIDACGRAVGVNTLTGEGAEGGYHVNISLGARGLRNFLDSQRVSYRKQDDVCVPTAQSPPPPPVRDVKR